MLSTGKILYTCSEDGSITVHVIKLGRPLHHLKQVHEVPVLSVSTTFAAQLPAIAEQKEQKQPEVVDKHFILSGAADGTVALINGDTGKVLRQLSGNEDAVECVLLSSVTNERPSPNYAITGSVDGYLSVYDLALGNSNAPRSRVHVEHSVTQLMWAPVALAWRLQNEVREERSVQLPELESLSTAEESADAAAASPATKIELQVPESTPTAQVMQRLAAMHPIALDLLANSYVLAACADRSVICVDVRSGTVCRRWRGHLSAVMCLDASSDGLSIVSGSDDCNCLVYSPHRDISTVNPTQAHDDQPDEAEEGDEMEAEEAPSASE